MLMASGSVVATPGTSTGSGAPAGSKALLIQLGWTMQRLYRTYPRPAPASTNLPVHLPGVSRQSKLDRARADVGLASTCLTAIAAALTWPADRVPELSAVRTALTAFDTTVSSDGHTAGVATHQVPSSPDPGTHAEQQPAVPNTGTPTPLLVAYRRAVYEAHVTILREANAAGGNAGKAYNLGRALADTTRPNQTADDFHDSFKPQRLTQLQHDLDDQTSVLSDHAAKSVVQSLTWWRDELYLADDTPTGKERRNLVGSVRTDAPNRRRRPYQLRDPRLDTSRTDTTMDRLAEALVRQGELWRLVLTGGKKPMDLLTSDDYLAAAERAVRAGRRMALGVLTAQRWLTATVFVGATAALVGVVWVIYGSDVTGGGKVAGLLAAVAGYLVSLGRTVRPGLGGAAAKVGKPLWDSAIDFVCAEAVSVPPVGPRDATGWVAVAAAAAKAKAEPENLGSSPKGAASASPPIVPGAAGGT